MGCDIHFFVEKKAANNASWERAEAMVPNPYLEYEKDGAPEIRDEWYHERNYSLFAMLADVRNGYGFAGVPTGKPIIPIDDPRGLPQDASPEVTAKSDRWGEDGHSHSFFTIYELLSTDWQQPIVHYGEVDAENFDRWQKFGQPNEWSGSITGPSIRHVDNKEMRRLIEKGEVATSWNRATYTERHGKEAEETDIQGTHGFSKIYTRIEWTTSWSEAARGEWFETLARMARVALRECDGDLNAVRAVFWFDN